MEINYKSKSLVAAALLAGSAAFAPQASAVLINTDASVTDVIPGLTGYATSGAMMDGMSVTASFTSGLTQTLSWADTGANSGGVFGTGWSLSVSGDTFDTNAWTMSTGDLVLTDLRLDGRTGLTLFDRTFGGLVGTDGSALGKDIDTGTSATYSHQVAIGAAAPVGDLWHVLDVNFVTAGAAGVSGRFTFSQDADNDSRFSNVPEPSILALLGAGLLGFNFVRRRKVA
jgi:hypothetical protein